VREVAEPPCLTKALASCLKLARVRCRFCSRRSPGCHWHRHAGDVAVGADAAITSRSCFHG
jgi:hypothetical protein